MPKQITIQNVRINDIILSKEGEDYVFSVAYSLLDEQGQVISSIRRTIKDFTTIQKTKIATIFQIVEDRLKQIEEI